MTVQSKNPAIPRTLKEFKNLPSTTPWTSGQKLVSLQIKNLQPLLAGVLLKKKFYEPGGLLSTFQDSLQELIPDKQEFDKCLAGIDFCLLMGEAHRYGGPTEFEQYLESAQNGNFYEELTASFYPGKKLSIVDSKKLEGVIALMFSPDNEDFKASREHKLFEEHFPAISAIFDLFKNENHLIIPHILQTLRKLIFDRISKRLLAEHPKLTFCIIGESIATAALNKAQLEQVIKAVILDITGLHASLGMET